MQPAFPHLLRGWNFLRRSTFLLTIALACASGALAQSGNYQRDKLHPAHTQPTINSTDDSECLACHAEILRPSVRAQSPAGLSAQSSKAWYQQTSTYQGEQDTFHRRHLSTPMAKELMNLRCNTCHQGSNPRDQHPMSAADTQRTGGFVTRKSVDPEKTCLMCHGQMNYTVMGLPDAWPKSKDMFQNNCMLCHAAIRTERHKVNFLNAEAIEKAGATNGDTCYGCHGGRAWYRLNFPYPRHAWNGMPDDTPAWAKTRPTSSNPRFLPTALKGPTP